MITTILAVGALAVIFCLVLGIGHLQKEVNALKDARLADAHNMHNVIRSVENVRSAIAMHQEAITSLARKNVANSEKEIAA